MVNIAVVFIFLSNPRVFSNMSNHPPPSRVPSTTDNDRDTRNHRDTTNRAPAPARRYHASQRRPPLDPADDPTLRPWRPLGRVNVNVNFNDLNADKKEPVPTIAAAPEKSTSVAARSASPNANDFPELTTIKRNDGKPGVDTTSPTTTVTAATAAISTTTTATTATPNPGPISPGTTTEPPEKSAIAIPPPKTPWRPKSLALRRDPSNTTPSSAGVSAARPAPTTLWKSNQQQQQLLQPGETRPTMTPRSTAVRSLPRAREDLAEPCFELYHFTPATPPENHQINRIFQHYEYREGGFDIRWMDSSAEASSSSLSSSASSSASRTSCLLLFRSLDLGGWRFAG